MGFRKSFVKESLKNYPGMDSQEVALMLSQISALSGSASDGGYSKKVIPNNLDLNEIRLSLGDEV